jgi:hypothetical protein
LPAIRVSSSVNDGWKSNFEHVALAAAERARANCDGLAK